jgi:hypothetical protein
MYGTCSTNGRDEKDRDRFSGLSIAGKITLKVTGFNLARNRVQWWAFLKTVTNLCFTKLGKFLDRPYA